MLNPEQDQQLFNKKPHINKAPSQQDQYLIKVKDHNYHTIDQFQEETDTCSIVAHLLMIN